MVSIISDKAIERRKYWISEIQKLSGDFGSDAERLNKELRDEVAEQGPATLIDHLRLCGNIPERYSHDSSEEKLYSKYTDSILCLSYQQLGLTSIVLTERADAADVEAVAEEYSFVGDAKAFRLSRTAKNQKDFKVQAMDGWKNGKPYAMVVCPIYQLPSRSSQIYKQAINFNVCIFSYSHMALLLTYANIDGKTKAQELLKKIFETVRSLDIEEVWSYPLVINKMILSFSQNIPPIWDVEKRAAAEVQQIEKKIFLTYEAQERERKLRLGLYEK
jgi:type II restriction enzyme